MTGTELTIKLKEIESNHPEIFQHRTVWYFLRFLPSPSMLMIRTEIHVSKDHPEDVRQEIMKAFV